MRIRIRLIQDLLRWMERNLKSEKEFTHSDIATYFADEFTIKTNNRIVNANPLGYKDYLYGLKSRLRGVHYEIEELLEADQAVVAVFVIRLDFLEKEPVDLKAISIFKFNDQDKIIEWLEVFAEAEEKLVYDK